MRTADDLRCEDGTLFVRHEGEWSPVAEISTIERHFEEYKVQLMIDGYQPLLGSTQWEREEVFRRMFARGFDVPTIAKRLDTTKRTVQRWHKWFRENER